MSEHVTDERWREAQTAEREYWAGMAANPQTVAANVATLVRMAQWARPRMARADGSEWVEIGIGPLGVGVAQFARAATDRTLVVGVDPIDLDELGLDALPGPLAALVERCRTAYQHVVARGEQTGLESGRFDAAFLHNMLDHVEAPEAVLLEARRLLRDGGHLLLACDVFSTAGRLKHEHWNRRRYAQSILVRAHPHRFSHRQLLALVERAGFTVQAVNGTEDRWERIAGRAHDVYVHATV